jgi:F-type H+-transporting ATPase subunit epsilon
MPNTFHCTIVTPTASAFEGEVGYANFPSWDGQYGMLPGMAPLLTRLAPGSLRLDVHDGDSLWYLIEGGFAHVDADGLSLVTEGAIPAGEIQLEEAEAELAEAEARVLQEGEDRTVLERRKEIARAKIAMAKSPACCGAAT